MKATAAAAAAPVRGTVTAQACLEYKPGAVFKLSLRSRHGPAPPPAAAGGGPGHSVFKCLVHVVVNSLRHGH